MLKFDLDVCYGDDVSNEDGDKEIRAMAARTGVRIVGFDPCGPGGGNPNYEFEAPDEASAFALVDAIYLPEDDGRESNRFIVYGDETEAS